MVLRLNPARAASHRETATCGTLIAGVLLVQQVILYTLHAAMASPGRRQAAGAAAQQQQQQQAPPHPPTPEQLHHIHCQLSAWAAHLHRNEAHLRHVWHLAAQWQDRLAAASDHQIRGDDDDAAAAAPASSAAAAAPQQQQPAASPQLEALRAELAQLQQAHSDLQRQHAAAASPPDDDDSITAVHPSSELAAAQQAVAHLRAQLTAARAAAQDAAKQSKARQKELGKKLEAAGAEARSSRQEAERAKQQLQEQASLLAASKAMFVHGVGAHAEALQELARLKRRCSLADTCMAARRQQLEEEREARARVEGMLRRCCGEVDRLAAELQRLRRDDAAQPVTEGSSSSSAPHGAAGSAGNIITAAELQEERAARLEAEARCSRLRQRLADLHHRFQIQEGGDQGCPAPSELDAEPQPLLHGSQPQLQCAAAATKAKQAAGSGSSMPPPASMAGPDEAPAAGQKQDKQPALQQCERQSVQVHAEAG